jgi:hypothetical protein
MWWFDLLNWDLEKNHQKIWFINNNADMNSGCTKLMEVMGMSSSEHP